MTDPFQVYGTYYDLLYGDKDYESEVAYSIRTLQSVDAQTRRLLEFGSGTGRHGRLLASRGFDVLGVERSSAMVDAARNASVEPVDGGKFNCIQGDIRTVELQDRFDAVLALFHVISYQTSNHEILQTFSNAARHLRPNGLFLFDVWHGPAVLCQRPALRVKRVEDSNTHLTRIAEPSLDTNSGSVTVHYTLLAESKATGSLTKAHEDHRMRYLFPSEVHLLADQTGFELLKTEEFLTGLPPSENTWGVAYLLRKRD